MSDDPNMRELIDKLTKDLNTAWFWISILTGAFIAHFMLQYLR